jgi:hypothetical protein
MISETIKSSWFRRNWKRFLSAVGVVLFVMVVAVLLSFRNADATALAMTTASSNPAFIDRIGQPINKGWLIKGSIQVSPGFGYAELAIPVSGPKGKGTLYALAVKRAGIWTLTFLQFGADGESSRLELLKQ